MDVDNTCNEWSEGASLETDERYGYQYLEAVRKVLDKSHHASHDGVSGAAKE